jgi:hypothetical protein
MEGQCEVGDENEQKVEYVVNREKEKWEAKGKECKRESKINIIW